MAVVAIASDNRVTLAERGLHTNNDRFLPNIKMAEPANDPHAVKLTRLLFESADQQHLSIEMEKVGRVHSREIVAVGFFSRGSICAVRASIFPFLLSPSPTPKRCAKALPER